MREFVFTVTYKQGADDLMDVFISNPDLYSRTLSCYATPRTMWRVDEVSGPEGALAEYDTAVAALSRCSNLRGMGGCEIEWQHEVLEEGPGRRVIYSRQSEDGGCRSIPYLVAHYLSDGVLFRAEQHRNEYVWRILAADSAAMSDVYDEIDRHLRDGLSLSFDRVERAPGWTGHSTPAPTDLPAEQRTALRLAVEYGYYEQPRQHSLQEIAEAEGIPTSTLQYRLNAAEGRLARRFLRTGRDGDQADPAPRMTGRSD
jgi:predicted DNA binding protein